MSFCNLCKIEYTPTNTKKPDWACSVCGKELIKAKTEVLANGKIKECGVEINVLKTVSDL